MLLVLHLAGRAVDGERQRERAARPHLAEAAARQEAAHAPEAEAHRHHQAGHVRRLPEREAIALEQVPRRHRRADEAAVVRQAAGPELRPRPAVGLGRVADVLRGVPDAVIVRAQALGLGDGPVDLAEVARAQVDVVPEVAVGDHVQDARAGDAREQHRQPEIDHHVRILADALGPDRAHRGREDEPGQEQDEVAREADPEEREQLPAHATVTARERSPARSSGGAGR